MSEFMTRLADVEERLAALKACPPSERLGQADDLNVSSLELYRAARTAVDLADYGEGLPA